MSAPRLNIIAAFALLAMMMSVLPARLPDIQLRLGMGDGTLGMALGVGGLGALTTNLVSARVFALFTTRGVALAALTAGNLLYAALALAPDAASFFVLNFLFGAAVTLANIGLNVEADRVEASTGRRVMNTCHGTWSLTFLAVSLAGAGLRAAGVSAGLHLCAEAGLTILATFAVVGRLVPQPARRTGGPLRARRLALPTAATLAIIAFGAGADLLHGAARNWSIIFLRDNFATSRLIEGLALPAFVVTMALARLTADRRLEKYAPVNVARVHLALALAGATLVALAPGPGLALAGFGLIGAGVAVMYPMMVSAAARLPGRPAAESVAAMTLVVQLLMLGSPVAVGAISAAFSLRIAYAAFVPLLLVGLAFTRAAAR